MTMTDTNSFEGLISRLRSLGRKVRVAAVCPNDNSSAEALKRAAGDVFNDLHPREQHSPVFRF